MGVDRVFSNAERIGVLGSPSSTAELNVDILGTAVHKKLVGNLGVFQYVQDETPHYALGQITEIEMKNVWTQDPTMRGIIRQKGEVDPITEKQDTHAAKMTVSSVFADGTDGLEPSMLGTVPATGTSIRLLNEDIMKALLADYKDEIFYLGEAYGTDVNLPMWFKHFGTGSSGAGEAYHIGIFGKTGSGKSVLAKMMMLGYARHSEMNIFILDPQGEFSKDLKETNKIKQILFEELNREVDFHDLHNIVLTGDELFKDILVNSRFFDDLGVFSEDNKVRAANTLVEILKGNVEGTNLEGVDKWKQELPPYEYYKKDAFGRIWTALSDENIQSMIYTSDEPRERLKTRYRSADSETFRKKWQQIANLFKFDGRERAIKIKELVKEIGGSGSLVVIDLSESEVPEDILWNDSMRLVVIGEILERLANEAERRYKEDELLNCLVVLDEAHRLAPRNRPENDNLQQIKSTLIDAVRTTRKYGLGWSFISQTLSSIDSEIIKQIRIYVLGFGLALGAERRALMDIVGGANEAIGLYETFRDPHSSLGEKEFPFMAYGPISPLSFSGSPLFFNALKYPDEFAKVNFDL